MNRSWIALLAGLATPLAQAAEVAARPTATNAAFATPQEIRCMECHTTPNPTRDKPSLAPCPRLTPAQGPEVVLLDQLAAQYVPVIFAHKLHSQMAGMAGGCSLCHHFNPVHRILPCRDCHSAAKPGTILKPSLRGAYHRLCLKCHREWNQDTQCAVCHAKKTANSASVVAPDASDIMGLLHPNVAEPVVKIYRTTRKEGPLVTFRHQEHVQRFGFKCVDCHQEESCRQCHRRQEPVAHLQSLQAHHARCAGCHRTTGKAAVCAHCHSDQEIPPFNHRQTGLVLSEDHDVAVCVDCHVGGRFDQKPSCSACHEHTTYPEKLPGKKVKTP